MQLLYALESIRTPVWNALMSAVTHLGEETVFMAAALFVFWCVGKRQGYYLLAVGFAGTVLNQFLKLLFRIPRPWVLDENFTIVESARAQAEQLSRKLAAARAEVRRYQTRMFAFERTLLALKHDNAELETACEQAWEQLEQANARAEKAEAACRRAEAALAAIQQTAPETPAQPDTIPETVPQREAVEEQPAPETEELLCAQEQALLPEPAQSAWQPETRLEQMAAELMGWFDAMMPQE